MLWTDNANMVITADKFYTLLQYTSLVVYKNIIVCYEPLIECLQTAHEWLEEIRTD